LRGGQERGEARSRCATGEPRRRTRGAKAPGPSGCGLGGAGGVASLDRGAAASLFAPRLADRRPTPQRRRFNLAEYCSSSKVRGPLKVAPRHEIHVICPHASRCPRSGPRRTPSGNVRHCQGPESRRRGDPASGRRLRRAGGVTIQAVDCAGTNSEMERRLNRGVSAMPATNPPIWAQNATPP
jgi:hypothetical protein